MIPAYIAHSANVPALLNSRKCLPMNPTAPVEYTVYYRSAVKPLHKVTWYITLVIYCTTTHMLETSSVVSVGNVLVATTTSF